MLFKKPFKIKSNTRLKNSEGKVLRDEVIRAFPQAESVIDDIFPKKENLYCVKAETGGSPSHLVKIYVVQQVPIVFKYNDKVFPTVYFLWKCPQLLKRFTTNSFVVSKIQNGADLMLVGVYRTSIFDNDFLAQTRVCVNTYENQAAIAVGVTARSRTEMLKDENSGKCVLIYHFYGDHLCTVDNMNIIPLPNLGPEKLQTNEEDDQTEELKNEADLNQDNNMLEQDSTPNDDSPEDNVSEIETNSEMPCESAEITTEEMDSLIKTCFLAAVKYSKTFSVPVLTSSFYKLEMLTSCPMGKNLDVKKTSYKKLGKFLKQMMSDGVITITEEKKGGDFITAVNREHPMLLEFYLKKEFRPIRIEEEKPTVPDFSVTESCVITPAVLPLFKEFGYRKGDLIQETDVRSYITKYVKDHKCQNEENKRLVKLQDPVLANLVKGANEVTWEDLIKKVVNTMKSHYKVIGPNRTVEGNGKLQPISMKVETRSGNKKMTVIDNLELFGIDVSEFIKLLQLKASASAGLAKLPGKKTEQITVQGNQVLCLFNLLTEEYNIPAKYIKGMEFAIKKKK